MDALKIGELASRTGLTVRTLHHYDEIGLLKPSHRTDSGHRLYTVRDLGRLQQIVSLRQLGFSLDGWICAGEVGAYKPDPRMWQAASRRMNVPPGPGWWHVSAYADYDLRTARDLGLTCVFVRRPHCRPGPADREVPDLASLVMEEG